MKITVITARFSISGVPLAQIRLARALAQAGHDVEVIFGYVGPGLVVPDIPGVKLTDLGTPTVRRMFGAVRTHLLTRKPDVIFTAEDHLNALVYLVAILTRSRAKISGSSRVTPFDTYSNKPFSKRWVLKQVMRAVSWRADALTCVSKDMVKQYQEVFGRTRHVCIYNIVDDVASRARMEEPLDDPWVLEPGPPLVAAAGSLQPWKGFTDLVRAIRVLRDAGRDVRLMILGEGPQRGELEALIARLGLGDRVRLLGHIANPLKYFRRAQVFALSSTVEGLPNVLVEAMMCGCTPVSTNCPTGPSEVLQDGRFGILVPVGDPDAMAQGIADALDRPLAPSLLDQAVLPFEESTVMARHLEVLGLDRPAGA
jgi:glycosyltransferase involved in cell wall biosynthesis